MKRALLCLTLAALGASSLPAAAEDWSPWLIRGRIIGVIPDEDASVAAIGGNVKIDDAVVPELDITYFFTENVAAELILATAPHQVNHTPTNLDLGEAWLLPPTLTLQYHFQPKDPVWRPYIGAGVNYTIFYNVNGEAPGLDVDYDNAFGFALQAGIDFPINDNWAINVDVKKLWLNTDATLTGAVNTTADVDIDPWIIGVGLAYKF
ncbi:MAG: outer membrane beta-barrel protein [Alphaproteobacteria bacterium]|nr:outer membrane beta-barrel protein [Alphaproteobacteria bacterium]